MDGFVVFNYESFRSRDSAKEQSNQLCPSICLFVSIKIIYSGTLLKWTPSGPKLLSAVARCP